MQTDVIETPAKHRFEPALEGDDIAVASCRIDENGHLVRIHTKVSSACGGQGIGTWLATGRFDLIRASGRKAVPRCGFMARFYATQQGYRDIVAG